MCRMLGIISRASRRQSCRHLRYSSLAFLLSDRDSLYAYADVSDIGMEDYYRLMYAKKR